MLFLYSMQYLTFLFLITSRCGKSRIKLQNKMFIQYTFAIENQLNHVNYMLHSYTYLLIAPEILVIYFY